MLAAAMNAGDWVSAALAIVQIAAIVIGAAWAYWKFVRGRIFHRRAEPTVEGTLLTTGSSHAIRAKVSVENTGSADIPLRVALLTVSACRAGEVDAHGHPVWRDVARAHAFRNDEGEPDHVDIESQETIADDVVIPIPRATSGADVVAYRITCQVYERRKSGGGICWTTKAVVPARPAVATDASGEVGDAEELVAPSSGTVGESRHGSSTVSGTQEAGGIANVGGAVLGRPGNAPPRQRPADESEIEAAEKER